MLRGARQVGKTWDVRGFVKEANLDFVEINFEERVDLRAGFDESLEPQHLLEQLEVALDISVLGVNSKTAA